MGDTSEFGAVQNATLTVLVDNTADLGAKSTEIVRRFTEEALLAEHGLSILIDLQDGRTRILWDAGVTSISLLENARRMGIDITDVDAIALSHGHGDHTASMMAIIEKISRTRSPKEWPAGTTAREVAEWFENWRVPVVAHPAAFRERWYKDKAGTLIGPIDKISRAGWDGAGARVIESEGPYRLAPGCWTTGFVPRASFEKAGIPKHSLYREGNRFLKDTVEDDQAIVLNVQGKGLVVVAGCAHSGIVNTVTYARQISGVDKVWAILGGFHLMSASKSEVQQTIDAVKQFKPVWIAPSHCTGFSAMCEFARQMPNAFVQTVSGTTYLL